MHRVRSIPAVLCALGVAGRAHAEEVIYGPDGAPTVVQRKLHPITGKWEIGLDFSTALNTALVNHTGGLLTVANHPNEWLDLENYHLGIKSAVYLYDELSRL